MNAEQVFCIQPRLQVLPAEQIDYFHHRALELLETVGVRMLHPEALAMLRKAGAPAGEDGRVRIGAALVQEAIGSAPKQLVIYDRNGNPVMELGGGNTGGRNTYYGTGSDLRYINDWITGETRLTTVEDIASMARVVDCLPNTEFLMSYGIPSGIPLDRVYLVEFLCMVGNTTKPIVFTSDNGQVTTRIIQMAAAVAGGADHLARKPFVLNYAQPTSPLQHSEDAIGKMFACADHGVPVVYPPGMIPGATAPATLAGAIVQSLAESLSALTVHQLRRRGAPIVLGGAHGCMDMRTAINVYAAPERLKTEAVLASYYQHFGIPTWGFGGCTDAMALDVQAGMEFGLLGLWAALCGVNLAHDVAYLGSGMVGDLRAIVINDEINSYVRSVLRRGVTVDSEHLAAEAIARVGPGGDFLGDDHTLRHFRSELWEPRLSNRETLHGWKRRGSPAMQDRAGEQIREILDARAAGALEAGLMQVLEDMAGA